MCESTRHRKRVMRVAGYGKNIWSCRLVVVKGLVAVDGFRLMRVGVVGRQGEIAARSALRGTLSGTVCGSCNFSSLHADCSGQCGHEVSIAPVSVQASIVRTWKSANDSDNCPMRMNVGGRSIYVGQDDTSAGNLPGAMHTFAPDTHGQPLGSLRSCPGPASSRQGGRGTGDLVKTSIAIHICREMKPLKPVHHPRPFTNMHAHHFQPLIH